MCFFKAGLSCLSDGWEKHKKKVTDVSDYNKNVKDYTIPNSSLQNVRIYLSVEKLAKDELCVAKTAIIQL